MIISFSGDLYVESELEEFSIDKNLLQIYKSSDYSFSCFEAPICDKQLSQYHKIGPSLMQHDSVAGFLHHFSHVSLANNHSMDYGWEGCRQTISWLKQHGVVPVGASEVYPSMYEPVVLEKEGVRVAVFCWAEMQYGCCKNEVDKKGYAWMLNPITYKLIQDYKKKVDYVILFLHAGLEDVELPLIDWRLQFRTFIDYGADLVVASHPHVVQGKETYKGKSIYYSLGNLLFSSIFAGRDTTFFNSIVLSCEFTKESVTCNESFWTFSGSGISSADASVQNRFKELTEILCPKNWSVFEKTHNEMIISCWEEYYKSYYSFPIWKEKVHIIWYRRLFNKLMENYTRRCFLPPVSLNKIYHNITIDTHRFVVSRVCSLLENTY